MKLFGLLLVVALVAIYASAADIDPVAAEEKEAETVKRVTPAEETKAKIQKRGLLYGPGFGYGWGWGSPFYGGWGFPYGYGWGLGGYGGYGYGFPYFG